MSYKKESVLKAAFKDAPVMPKVPKTHKEYANKISNKKFR